MVKLLTSTRFVYGHEFDSQTGIFFLLTCFILLLFSLIRCARFAWSSNFSGFSEELQFLLYTKCHAVNSLSIRLSIMETLSGASENETRKNSHYSNDSKKIILQVPEVIIFSMC